MTRKDICNFIKIIWKKDNQEQVLRYK